ncbi:hypothetical protein HanHA300_Chr14g0535861 [Helianthus annuus]|nr:hypothetical protein HanHA300_Chr14g0535861 [Helianthus annuus]KAJ0486809.1 hypothetical protein HanHA89_Chr14g0583651 [Helianthus annuus]
MKNPILTQHFISKLVLLLKHNHSIHCPIQLYLACLYLIIIIILSKHIVNITPIRHKGINSFNY